MLATRAHAVGAILLSLVISCHGANQLCYYPDGITTDSNHQPCNLTISASSCCDPLDSCTTSNLCLGRSGFTYRGSCTDKTWTSPNCPSGCLADPFDKSVYDTFTPLWPCDKPGAPSTKYCCNSPGRNCCTIATFDYGTTNIAFKGGMDQMILELANLKSEAPATVTVTASATGAQASTTQASTQSAAATQSNTSTAVNLPTTVGLAVGLPLAALVAGLLALLAWRQKKKNQEFDPTTMELSSGKPFAVNQPGEATMDGEYRPYRVQPGTSSNQSFQPGNGDYGKTTGPHELI